METWQAALFKGYGIIGPAAYFYPAPFGRDSDHYASLADDARRRKSPARFVWAFLAGCKLPGATSWLLQESVVLLALYSQLYALAIADSAATARAAGLPGSVGAAALFEYLLGLSAGKQVLVGMITAHYINRAIVYPLFTFPQMSPSHPAVVASAAMWQYLNGTIQAIAIHRAAGVAQPGTRRFAAAIGIFVLGMAGNVYHDGILARLRSQQPSAASTSSSAANAAKGGEAKHKDRTEASAKTKLARSKQGKAASESESHYTIPHGGLFSLLSYPHYVLEWLEWAGYAILLDEPEGWWFVALLVAVMAPRAIKGHDGFYRNTKFRGGERVPPGRKAIVPFLL